MVLLCGESGVSGEDGRDIDLCGVTNISFSNPSFGTGGRDLCRSLGVKRPSDECEGEEGICI